MHAAKRVLIGCLLALGAFRAAEPIYRSPACLVADAAAATIYVTEVTAHEIAEVDVATGKVRRVITLPDPPGGLVLAADGKHLYVTGAVPHGRVHVVDLPSGTIERSMPVGHTPLSPVFSPDGSSLYVCNRFDNEISVLDPVSGAVRSRIPVTREPMAAALTPNGRCLVVINHLPNQPATADVVAAEVTLVDTVSGAARHLLLPNGSTGLEGVCVSPDGGQAFVTHILGRYQQPTTQLERGWMNTNALSIVDLNAGRLLATVLLDQPDLGAANPWGVACSADGAFLCVAHAGTHELSLIDRPGLLRKIAASASVNDLSYNLGFLGELRRRIRLSGKGPRGVVVARDTVYAAEYFSDSLGVVRLNAPADQVGVSWPLAPAQPLNQVRLGEMAFNDASRCFQHWQSCASCHPGEARVDGLNWDLMNDGMGNPKNVRSMLLAHRTPPSMSLGVRENAEKAVRSGFRFIQYTVVDEEIATAVDAYLSALTPVPSPHLKNGRLSAQQEEGRSLFTSASCMSCHTPPLYTNLKQYDLGTTSGMDKGHKVDVPTLVEVWRTAPYLHDGRALTLREVFLPTNNPKNKHGDVQDLTSEQLDALVAYVLTL